jgi:ABC-type branched-chain amino acid transport systems, ATPase component
LLRVENLAAFYGPVQILHDINLAVDTGQIVALVGANAPARAR